MRVPVTWNVLVFLVLTLVTSAVAQSTSPAVSVLPASGRDEPAQITTTCESRAPRGDAEPPSIAGQREYATRYLNDRLSHWKKELQLDEWTVSVTMIRRDDLRPKILGKIRWDKRRKTAAIEVMDPAYYKLSFRPMLADMEFTIVHELVHLELAGLPRSEASRSQEEHAVNRIAESLLRLDSRR